MFCCLYRELNNANMLSALAVLVPLDFAYTTGFARLTELQQGRKRRPGGGSFTAWHEICQC